MKKKLRVAMFIQSQPSAGGGVQEHVYYLSHELRKRGISVEIFGAESTKARYQNFTPIAYAIEVPTLNGNWGYISILKTGIDFQKLISPKKFDIFHIHEPYSPFAPWNLIQNIKDSLKIEINID